MADIHRILLSVLARARRIDRDQALLGALGVGASVFPHQFESVQRMITGTSCRWLLADEVGLGKTIEAIMVMRALAAQNPRPLQVALVAPDDLAGQWEEELLCRGHVVALEDEAWVGTGNFLVRLVRPSVMTKDRKVLPGDADLLLIDEFPRLTVQVRRDLASAARRTPHVLLMSATPQLHVPAYRNEILAILEPEAERAARATNRDIIDVLAEREAEAADRYGPELHDAAKRRMVGECYGTYRRVVRTQRSDNPEVLPRRAYQPLRVGPTDGDVGRNAATRAFIAAARAEKVDMRDDLLLQVAGRSPRSLRERLSTLNRSTPSLQNAWGALDRVVREQPGDARLDALIDHVRQIRAGSPKVRILVVAEDNPTTDYLQDALERLADVKVARKRRAVGAEDELEEQLTALKDALDPFVTGEATVLVAADVAREGHNLQFAEEIVFFALPWSPTAVQQWIGRIDRIGAAGGKRGRKIRITPIVVEGSPEARVLDVLEDTRVFTSSELFDEADGMAIASAINAAAYGSEGATWNEAVVRARTSGGERDEWLRSTRFPPVIRTRIAANREEAMRWKPYAVPFGSGIADGPTWPELRELAAEAMIGLAQEDHLEVRNAHDGMQRCRSMWYRSRIRAIAGPVYAELEPSSSWSRQVYLTRRSQMACPPRPSVVQGDKKPRRLRFFDHGDALHDCLVKAFERDAPKSALGVEHVVELPEGHPLLQWDGQRLLSGWGEIDFAARFTFDVRALPPVGAGETSKPEADARADALGLCMGEYQADRRWLVELCPPQLLFATMVVEDDGSTEIDAAAAMLTPMSDGGGLKQRGQLRSRLSPDRLKSARAELQTSLEAKRAEASKKAARALQLAVPTRMFAAEADFRGLRSALATELSAVATLDMKFEYNKASLRAAELSLRLVEAAWACRSRRIAAAEAGIVSATLVDTRTVVIVPRAVPDD